MSAGMPGGWFGCVACTSSPTFPTFLQVQCHLEEVHGVRGLLEGPATRAVLLPSTLTSHSCLLCGKEGLKEKELLHHLSSTHGEFFARRKGEYSSTSCRICDAKIDNEDVEEHMTTCHPLNKFANSDKKLHTKPVKTKKSLEEVTELGKIERTVETDVTRRLARTKVELMRGEADLVVGRAAKTINNLWKETKTKVSGLSENGSDEPRCAVIEGSEEQVLKTEAKIVEILTKGTYVKMMLKKGERDQLLKNRGESVKRLQDASGAYISSNGCSLIISGLPEAVRACQALVREHLASKVIWGK